MNLFIRADADSQIGTGHVMRCLALAQAWQEQDGKAIFISRCQSDVLRQRLIKEGMDFITIEKPHPDPGDLEYTMRVLDDISKQNPQNTTWFVIDGYHFDGGYQKRLREAGYKILWIDDYGHADHYYADLVLNQNTSANASLYAHREPYTRLLLGTPYALLRREFKQWQGWQREIPTIARKVLVTLGGGDPDNVTLKVIQALKQVRISGLEAKIVVGPANPHLSALERAIADHLDFQLITNASDMPGLMAWADIAISAGGSTCWELSFMGTPFLTIVLAENQRQSAYHLKADDMTRLMNFQNDIVIADLTVSLESMLVDGILRRKWSQKVSAMIDGDGAKRVVGAICKEKIGRGSCDKPHSKVI